MEDKYYVIQKKMHPESRKVATHHGLSFVEVSEGVLEHIAGDWFMAQALELVEGELKAKGDALLYYSIFPVSKKQFDFYVRGYEERLQEEKMRERVHSMRQATGAFGRDRTRTPLGGND